MFGLPIVVAALALMGAPAGTTVSCNPSMQFGTEGLTYFHGGNVLRVDFSKRVCVGLIYASATPAERRALRRLNPGEDFVGDTGTALLVVLHESVHASGQHSEACAEGKAVANLPAFAASVLGTDKPLEAGAVAAAMRTDALLPPAYHGPCLDGFSDGSD